jgi:hypothetical protein
VVKGPAADATNVPQPWGLLCSPTMKMKMMIIFCPFPSNGAPVEWNLQRKTEELGEKPVPVPLCPPQISHGLTRDRTRTSAVGGRRLTAWAMARPTVVTEDSVQISSVSQGKTRYWILAFGVQRLQLAPSSRPLWLSSRLRSQHGDKDPASDRWQFIKETNTVLPPKFTNILIVQLLLISLIYWKKT